MHSFNSWGGFFPPTSTHKNNNSNTLFFLSLKTQRKHTICYLDDLQIILVSLTAIKVNILVIIFF